MQTAASTYLQYGQGQLNRIKAKTGRNKFGTDAVEVHVTAGSQTGSHAKVDLSDFSIGPTLENDLFVFEEDTDAGDISVSVKQSFLGPLVSLSTQRSDVKFNGILIVGEASPEKLPCAIDYSGHSLTIGVTTDYIEARNERRSHFLPTVFAAAAFFILGFALLHSEISTSKMHIGSVEPKTISPNLSDILTDVDSVLEQTGVAKFVTIEQIDDRTLRLFGEVSQTQATSWQSALPNLDAILSQYTVIYDVRDTTTIGDLPAVTIVTLGETPSLTLADGRRVYLEDKMTGEWELIRVEDSEFILKREDEEIKVEYW